MTIFSIYIKIFTELLFFKSLGRIFSQAVNELGASSFPARNELSMLFPYTSFPAGNELILKLTKNTTSEFFRFYLTPEKSEICNYYLFAWA